MLRDIARHVIARPMQAILGRRQFARFARLLTLEARLDGAGDDIRVNGELMLLREVLRGAKTAAESVVVMDVGANIGDWTALALAAADEIQLREVRVVACEPVAGTRALLAERLERESLDARVDIIPLAMSDAPGEAVMTLFGSGSGRNTLIARDAPDAVATTVVQCDTVDAVCARLRIERILMLKIDAEGHDAAVLRGASAMLSSHRIRVVQFEYNQSWIDARSFLKDAFDLLLPRGYRVGKVTRNGVECFDRWDFELESWRQANFVAWLASDPCPGRTFPWWNS